jgi:hypothetical protein
MVVLAAAVCTKSGKALVSRQFVDISRVRIEGLLAAFPKLMGSGKQNAGVQHTFIETESIRYVYQPLENLYMLLLTNKSSNILEDLETLHLLAKIVPEYCRILEEDEITEKAFELIFAFDEVIAVGYREKVTLQQIKTFMEMDSQEEKIHEMLERNKEREAKEEAKRRRHQIERMRQENARAPSMSSISSQGGGPRSGSWASPSISPETPNPAEAYVVKDTKPARSTGGGRQGMVLGQKEATNTNKFLQAMKKEEGTDLVPTTAATDATTASHATIRQSVNIEVVENVSVTLENDGGMQGLDIRGDLTLTIEDPAYARALIKLAPADHKQFHFKAHPNINKPQFMKDKVIAVKGKAFPTNTPLNLLKWRVQTNDESLLPLTVNCWPTPGGGANTVVNMEYELHRTEFSLGNVTISIPIVGGSPVVGEVDGTYEFDIKNHILRWHLDLIDESNSSGSMEFTLSNADPASLFPIDISFTSPNTFCPIQVDQVVQPEGDPVPFSFTKTLHTDQYRLQR